ncbi:MAG: hypothetical protein NVSMB17_15350 [Candidatus Dormibacteria bacterium]
MVKGMGKHTTSPRPALDALPRLASITEDALLREVIDHFQGRTGVRIAAQDLHQYTGAALGGAGDVCTTLVGPGACSLLRPRVGLTEHHDLPLLRTCAPGMGHLVIPVMHRDHAASSREIGRIVSTPFALRPVDPGEVFAATPALRAHPDSVAAALAAVPVVDVAEVKRFCDLVTLVLRRISGEMAGRARDLAVAVAFEEVGLHGSREVIRSLLAGLVREFSESDATVLSTRAGEHSELQHQPSFSDALTRDERRLLTVFTAEVVQWISQTGYPISFPDLGGSPWRRHVLDGHELEGSLVAVPVKMPGEGQGWWTAYYRHPAAEMEDRLHRLAVLAAQSAQTLTFVSQLEASEEAAMTDALTRLGNRRFLQEQLERELARSSRGHYPISMIILDIDNFKGINDTHGHSAGDDALRLVADALRQPLRRSNTICRYGGDEFCVVIPECTSEEAVGVAGRLREEVEKVGLVVGSGRVVHLQLSAGIATQDPAEPSGADLFELADQALIKAKKEGKDRVVVSTPGAAP